MLVSATEGHRLWAPVYDSNPNPLLALESRIVRGLLRGRHLERLPKRVVDAACGTGRWMLHFHQAGATVVGIDSSREMLAQAARHGTLRSRLILGDAQDMPLADEIADLVICSFSASYAGDLGRLMRELARITVRGGNVVVSDMHHSAVAAGWRRSFKIGVTVYELEHYDRSPDEIRAAGEAQGLRLDREEEASFDEEERAIFERAGKQHLYARVRKIPAVWAGMWTKSCC
jgi:ubiquinone/menaquinone biosynthesis C-methylase UbiE